MQELAVKKLTETALMPQYATEGAAAADICADCIDGVKLMAGCRTLINTGIAMAIPKGYVGLIFARSGLASKGIALSNSVGVIDSDYRGELKVALHNSSNDDFFIDHGMRIAQLAIMPVVIANFTLKQSLPDTVRGDGGFGSTGVV